MPAPRRMPSSAATADHAPALGGEPPLRRDPVGQRHPRGPPVRPSDRRVLDAVPRGPAPGDPRASASSSRGGRGEEVRLAADRRKARVAAASRPGRGRPARPRSSSTGCERPERLATIRIVSSCQRAQVGEHGLVARAQELDRRRARRPPTAGAAAMSRRIVLSSDAGVALLRGDVHRLVAVDGIGRSPAGRAGRPRRWRSRRCGRADHCIGVRTPLRSPRWTLSPMPISSP